MSDMNYVTQNASRIARAVFEIVLNKNLPFLSERMLRFAKVIEKQMWDFEHPLRQHPLIKQDIVSKLENRNFTLEKLRELDGKEIGHLIHHVNAGHNIKRAAEEILLVEIDAMNKPAFQGIKQHSPTKPVLIFVSSRRQTRVTASVPDSRRQSQTMAEHG